jgi:hypothetical protein
MTASPGSSRSLPRWNMRKGKRDEVGGLGGLPGCLGLPGS